MRSMELKLCNVYLKTIKHKELHRMFFARQYIRISTYD